MKVSADGQLPFGIDKTLAYSLYAIFRAFAKQINALTEAVMTKAIHSPAIAADTLVRTGPSTYRGFTITVVTAVGTIDIRDGVAAGGGTIIDTIPIGTAAGTRVQNSVGVTCETGLFVDFNGGATGTLVLLYEGE
jgi:hypothetical protein